MSNALSNNEYPEVEPAPLPGKRGWTVIAWIIILTFVGLVVWGRSLPDRGGKPETEDRLGLVIFELQARYLVGAADLMGRRVAFEQALQFNRGPVPQRLRFIVLAGELQGPEVAILHLESFDKQVADHQDKVTMSAEQAKVRALLGELYQSFADGKLTVATLSQEERQFLREQLGWFGDLALAHRGLPLEKEPFIAAVGPALAAPLAPAFDPEQVAVRQQALEPAQQTFAALLSAVLAGLFLGLCGFVGLMVLIILAATGTVKSGLRTGSLHGGLYAETFALWMALFLGLFVLGERLAPEGTGLYLAAGLMLLSLVVLGWPVFRGLSWRQVREDIGLTLGNRPGWEPLVGVGSYLMSLPLLGLGFIVTLFLMSLQREVSSLEGDPFAPAGGPAHPVIQPLVEGDWDIRLQIIFLASVVAPIVEETMFRGVLHRHLREASARFGAVMSILLSATVVSFIFAVIHPQGLIAVPALMGLAFGFSIAREWRGTLIPCMVAHGVSNGLVTMLAIMALGN